MCGLRHGNGDVRGCPLVGAQVSGVRSSCTTDDTAIRQAIREGNKTDFACAEAIYESACRPTMRFVAAKTAKQQTLFALHRVREALVCERTATSNQPAVALTGGWR